MRARSVSSRTSGEVKIGSASRATKTKMRTTAAIPVSATRVMTAWIVASRICRRRIDGGASPPPPWVQR